MISPDEYDEFDYDPLLEDIPPNLVDEGIIFECGTCGGGFSDLEELKRHETAQIIAASIGSAVTSSASIIAGSAGIFLLADTYQ